MSTDMHAAGVQRGIIAGGPTGFRRLSVASMATESQAREFGGFGNNGPRPGQILAAFKAAAPFLGYGARIVHAVDWLFRFTAPQDWLEGARPIVWPSARMQQEELQLSGTRVKALNRLLIELGLVAAKDSPNGKRYGRRDRDGKIIEAYGFDLSPLAQRLEEFERVAEEGREERARMGQLRRRGGKAKWVVGVLALAALGGVAGMAVVNRPAWAQPTLNRLGLRGHEDAVAAVAPPPPSPVEAVPPPAPAPPPPAPEPVAQPAAVAAPGADSPLNPHFTNQTDKLTDDQKQRLADADKKGHGKKGHGVSAHASSGASPKPKSTTFTTGGSKYDPLNSSI